MNLLILLLAVLLLALCFLISVSIISNFYIISIIFISIIIPSFFVFYWGSRLCLLHKKIHRNHEQCIQDILSLTKCKDSCREIDWVVRNGMLRYIQVKYMNKITYYFEREQEKYMDHSNIEMLCSQYTKIYLKLILKYKFIKSAYIANIYSTHY